ncbi:cytochrome c biogenesis protein CcsA [Campylobacter sp.]|uniref:cytochrome c biogenesis protein n=1 Tax=Campylobacter sp. TaxID=205 RepID=UPI0026DBE748|nr:cytochrome c biogenesis protein CcsA [Campylobacter sp.]MDO4674553.1 cytochrome c biogenesis protein CcsA [Campylobacter sp.]
MRRALKGVGDLRISIVLFLLFALSCALATLIESAYKTPTAWAMVYGTTWFGYIQLLLGINLLCGIFAYRMLRVQKLPVALFHASFLCILIGSAMTRYGGFEGVLYLRENAANSVIESAKTSVRFSASEDGQLYSSVNDAHIALLPFANAFMMRLDMKDRAELRYENLILDADYDFKEAADAPPLLALMVSSQGSAGSVVEFGKGEIKTIDGVNFSFMNDAAPAPFVKIDKNLQLSSSEDLKFLSMEDGKGAVLPANSKEDAKIRRLYELHQTHFVVKFASLHATRSVVGANRPQDESFWLWLKGACMEAGRTLLVSSFGEPQKWKEPWLLHFKDFAMSKEYQALELKGRNALKLKLSYKGSSKELFVFEHDKPLAVELGGKKFFIAWNLSYRELPFELYLRDFVMQRYPGSNSPASYTSKVRVRDGGAEFDYEIFMNNVLDYRGYRFYQSSYYEDEGGTILSVNKDPGKIPTYTGYFLLCLGMFLNFFNPHSRFQTLSKLINKDAMRNFSSLIFLLFFASLQRAEAQNQLPIIDANHAAKLSTLMVQKFNGQMSPLDTLAREVLEKIHKNDAYKNQDASALMLSMMMGAKAWKNEPFIAMPKNKTVRDELAKILKIPSKQFIAFDDFFTEDGAYKLQRHVENANRKNPNARGVLDKELIALDERANILNYIFSGILLKIIPKQNDANNLWLPPFVSELEGEEGGIVYSLVGNYFSSVDAALQNGDWTKADAALELIRIYQNKFGQALIPSELKIKIELFVNEIKPFLRLAPVYLLAGILLLVLVLAKMIKENLAIKTPFKAVYYLNVLVFFAHSLALGTRAYLAGRAPWSNAYESMVYIAWALALSGILFSKKSPISLSLTSILAGVVLGVAHLSEANPQITPLMPVLHSYWLSIHVSVITASYGFLGLCALLGIFVLVLMCFLKRGEGSRQNILKNITEATRINEMAMILGLCLLTVGNFLGAIWANESWGRYWSWDSKETWALISILIYAAILHLRLIPRYANQFIFALWSMFAYWSIIMTYFGVNYFLVGLHSYAAGEATQIPSYVYWGLIFMVILALFAARKREFVGGL